MKLKKTLVTTAVMMAMSGSAYALEASIYGVGHLSADSIDDGLDSSFYTHSNSSRIGVKGSHKLSSDLSVLFQYESGVDLTGRGEGDGNGPGTNNTIFTKARDSFVGLGGSFGTFLVGRLPAHNQWLYDFNLFGDQVGDLGNIFGANLPGRVDGALHYRTPSFNGLQVGLSYLPEQGTKNGSASIVKFDYASGGLKLGAAYMNMDKAVAGTFVKDTTAVSASYDFGQFTIGGAYQNESKIGNLSGVNVDKYTLGATVKVGANGTLKAQYTAAGKIGKVAKTDASQFAVGYDYAYDKATTFYVAYAQTDNGLNSGYSAYNWGHGDQGTIVNFGKDVSAFSVGLVYKFDVGLMR